MASTRAREVAEVLWELKRADKVATYTAIASRAGFSAGTNGRTMQSCLKTVRRDWAHLQWWRAIADDRLIQKGSEHEIKLRESGFELEPAEGKNKTDALTLAAIEEHLMNWEETGTAAVAE